MRIVCDEAIDYVGCRVCGYEAVHAGAGVEKAGEGGFCDGGGDGALVELVVLFPEVAPAWFVRLFDGANVQRHGF